MRPQALASRIARCFPSSTTHRVLATQSGVRTSRSAQCAEPTHHQSSRHNHNWKDVSNAPRQVTWPLAANTTNVCHPIEPDAQFCLPIRCAQSPTNCGWEDVHALGSMVSRVLANPWMMLKPETLAVMEPSVDAASAVVERCPMEMTDATTSEYSKRCVLCKIPVGHAVRLKVERGRHTRRLGRYIS